MPTELRAAAAGAWALLLCGCWSNSLPTAQGFIRPLESECPDLPICDNPQAVHVFSDMNGTFYPRRWQGRIRKSAVRSAKSLYNATASGSQARDFVDRGERELLAEIAGLQNAGGRIFILVHGYNNKVEEADEAFEPLEGMLDLKPADRVIRFYWDGHTGSGVGGARIWLYAAGNSQLVGSRALRRILERFRDREIYLIGHSRGTSVILSALGNPVYAPRFLKETKARARRWKLDPERFMNPPAFDPRGNRIRVLVAAPAVDRIDFCGSTAQSMANGGPFFCPLEYLRPLPVVSFRYTINEDDKILNKFLGLSRWFNPTGLGAGKEARPPLRDHYKTMRPHPMPPDRSHAFAWYVKQRSFCEMLAAEKIARGGGDCR
jgi:hypothetical protein